MKRALALLLTLVLVPVGAQQARAGEGGNGKWDAAGAAAYLDARMGLAYALSRPVLRRVMHVEAPAAQEAKLLDDTIRRVDAYGTHQVLYDFNERRQIVSRGTEAVLNAVILTSADAARKLREPSASTKKALNRLWETQRADGRWDWLEFGLEPWETTEAAYHGATFAAFAVGTAGGAHDAAATAGIERLRTYLSTNYPSQHLYNRTWTLLASTRLKGLVTEAQRKALIDELVRTQRDDGGWSLEALGGWKWSKTAPPVKSPGDLDESLLSQSDGYATGLVVYTLKQAGVAASDATLRTGVRWLETNQRPSPVPDVPGRAWPSHSLNYNREQGGEKGEPWRRLFMTDTATAFAILALAD